MRLDLAGLPGRNRRGMAFLVLLFFFGLTGSPAFSIEPLFHDILVPSSPGNQALNAKSDLAVIRSRPVTIDLEQLSGPGIPEGADSILLNLFDNVSFVASKNRLERRAADRYTWFGSLQEVESSQVVLAVEQGDMAGNITANGRMYQIRSAGTSAHTIREVDPSLFPDEADPVPVSAETNLTPFSSPSPLADDGSVIDVLVVYTAAAAASGNISLEIQLAIDETNQSYINSGIVQRVRLVHAEQVDYAESGNGSLDLTRLRNPSDGYMDNVHTLRDSYGGDVVSLWVSSFDACGIGYLMTAPVSTSFAPYAFSVVRRSCATGYYSFGHEMGHNMGAAHDRYVNDGSGAYPYSYGYVYTPGRWRTIMAYDDECRSHGYSCTRIPNFSNPDVSYGGVPTGISISLSNSADNRLTLNNSAYTVANFTQSAGSQIVCTVTTNPAGLSFVVDGTHYNAPQTFNWAPGSSHTLSASSPQSGTSGIRYLFSSWSDGGGQSHPLTAPFSNTPYTANFTTQYSLTTSVNSLGAGTVNPPGTNWYDSGQTVQISASANSGYSFTHWSGDFSGSASTADITMNGPKSITANFASAPETISAPGFLTGPVSGVANTAYDYTAGGSSSSQGDPVEYQFDWRGDGMDLSLWGSSTQTKAWPVAGAYAVKARARCAIHTDKVSSWSGSLMVSISEAADGPNLSGAWSLPVIQICRPTGVSERCKIQGSLTLTNVGNRDASRTTIHFYLSDNATYDPNDLLLKNVSAGKIKAGASRELKLTYRFLPGLRASGKFIIAVIDSPVGAPVGDESNNQIVFGPIP